MSKIVPVPLTIPMAGLVCWHDLYFPNVLLHSNNFDNASWAKLSSGTGSVPVVTAGQTDPYDGANAYRVQFDKGAGTANTDYSILTQTSSVYANPHAGSVGIWLRSHDGASEYQMSLYESGASAVYSTVTVTGTWQRFTYSNMAVFSANGGLGISLRGGQNTSDSADVDVYAASYHPAAVLPPYVPTTTLQSIPDLSGNGNTLYRGSNTSAYDTNDPTVLGPGLSFVTDDGGKTGDTGISKTGTFSLLHVCKPTGTSGTLISLADSATTNKYQRVAYNGAGKVRIGSIAGGVESFSADLTVDATANQLLHLTNDGTTLTLTRLDTGTSVTLADANPDGNACLGIGCTPGSTMGNFADAHISLGNLGYNRKCSPAEAQRVRRVVKSTWAARPGGVVIL